MADKPINPILSGLTESELKDMKEQHCMRGKKYKKGELIFHIGDQIKELGIVLMGQVIIESIDLWGNKALLSSVPAGQVFAETYALLNTPIMVNVVAAEDCHILFINTHILMQSSFSEKSWQHKLTKNLLAISTRKNLTLSNRIFCTTSKKIRGRLLTYLSGYAVQQGKSEFDIPFNRQQLADFLNLDRSALSKELCKMRDEGMLTFRKNHFHLLHVPKEEESI